MQGRQDNGRKNKGSKVGEIREREVQGSKWRSLIIAVI